ncbi:MAG TPA: protein kinase [Gemmataceae bacterium]
MRVQLHFTRVVALKMIWGRVVGTEERVRFQREAKVVAQLQHANIVQIFEVGEDRGESYLSLKYVDGGNLVQRLPELGVPALDPKTRKDRAGRTWSRRPLGRRKP